MKRFVCLAFAAAMPVAAAAIEPDPVPVTLLLEGLVAKCCEDPVESALGKMENVEGAKLRKDHGWYLIDISVKKGYGVPRSQIDKALEQANQAMGQRMGTKYVVSDAQGLAPVHLIKTKEAPDEAKLKKALAALPGFRSVQLAGNGFAPAFDGPRQATLAEVIKASDSVVEEIVFAPARGRVRYSCATHPERAASSEIKCPDCDAKMTKGTASTPTALPPAPKKKSGGHGH